LRRLANFIGGEFVPPAGGKYFEDINPATEEWIAEVPDGDREFSFLRDRHLAHIQ
jgi:aldehyde dehydrogenase